MRFHSTRSTIAAFAFATSCLAAPAFAQDAEEDGFNGLYVGGSVGMAVQSNDTGSRINFDRNLDGTFTDTVTTTTGANAFSPGFCNGPASGNSSNFGCSNDDDAIDYAAHVGYDRQFGNIVAGIVGEFGKTEITDSVSGFTTTPAAYRMTRRVDYMGAVRARIGYTPQGTTLFYATGGGAYTRVANAFRTTNNVNSFTTNGNYGVYGFQVGGGLEQKITENISIGVQYLYNDFKDRKARVFVRAIPGVTPANNPFLLGGTGTDFRRSDNNFRWHTGRITASFRF